MSVFSKPCVKRRIVAPVAVLAAALGTSLTLGSVAAQAAEPPLAHLKSVSYLGHDFKVPASWPVINLAAHPRTCVRFDRHAIYLGTPGAMENCPARAVGGTDAVLVQPSASRNQRARAVENPVEKQITAVGGGIEVTATYGTGPGQVQAILSSASLPAPAVTSPPRVPPPAARGTKPAGKAASPLVISSGSADTSYTGAGFDACSAPSTGAMSAWRGSSPYSAVGIYIGGSDRACAQPNLTAGWVSSEASASWHFIPLYVGPQAAFGQITSPASQAVSAAEDAVNQAASIGLGQGSTLYYDMEAYPSSDEGAVLTFISQWTIQLHDEGYLAGVYSSSASGISAMASNYTSHTVPDVIFDALWNGAANTADSRVPNSEWANHQRVHQYAGGHNETYGGVTINIDNDYLDAVPLEAQTTVSLPSGKCLDEDSNTIGNASTIVQTYACLSSDVNQQWSFHPQPNGSYVVTSNASGKCLDEDSNTIGNASTIVQTYACLSNDVNQQWIIHPQASGDAVITSNASGKCLDEDSNTIGNQSTVVQTWACISGDANQQWSQTLFTSNASGKCLDEDSNTIGNASTIVQGWSCLLNDVNQGWTIHPLDNGDVTVTSNASGKCLDEDSNTISNQSTIVQTWACISGDANQQWTIQPQANGSDVFISVASGKCLDEDSNTIGNVSTRIQTWACIPGDVNQEWSF